MRKKLFYAVVVLSLMMAVSVNAGPMAVQLTPVGDNTVATPVTLTWTAGDGATSHHVHYGTSYADISTVTTGYVVVPMPDTNYVIPSSTLDTLYYWRIDANAPDPNLDPNAPDVLSFGNVKAYFTDDGTAGDPALVLWLKFDNEKGTDFPTLCRDYSARLSGNDCVGVNFSAAATYAAGAPSAIEQSATNKAVELDVANPTSVVGLYPHAPCLQPLAVSGETTVAFWINADAGTTVAVPFHASAGFMFGVYFYTNTNVWWIADPVWHPMDGIVPPADWIGSWCHMAFTKNTSAGTMSMYINGILTASTGGRPYTFPAGAAYTYYGIGGWAYGNNTSAMLDDWRQYDIKLSDAEILRIAGKGDPNKAYRPDPREGSSGTSYTGTTLSWMAGNGATTHDVYLGTTSGSLSPLSIGQPGTTCPSGALGLAATCYWRVDEVAGTVTTTGDEWSFSTEDSIGIEDFESYPNDANLRLTWNDDAPGEYCFLETGKYHGGAQAMRCESENQFSPYYTTFERGSLPITDWTGSGIKSLSLWFRGDPLNSAQDLYVRVNDGSLTGSVKYPDSTKLQSQSWTNWNIPMTDAGLSALTLSTVDTLGIRVDEGTSSPSGCDLLYIDDIAVYPTRCVPEFGPACDISGDCVVDNKDLKLMSEDWLKCSTPFAAGCKPMNPNRIITPAPGTLVVDGNLAEWDAAGVTWHEFEEPWAIALPDDCNDLTDFEYAVTWDSNHIYVAARVTDRVQLTQDPPFPPIGDILEVRLEANGTFDLTSNVLVDHVMEKSQNYNLYQYPAGTPVATWSYRGVPDTTYPGGMPIAADANVLYQVALDPVDSNIICYELSIGTFSNYAGAGGTPPTTYRTMAPGTIVGFDIQVDSLREELDPTAFNPADRWGAILSSWARTTTTPYGYMHFEIVGSQATACGDWDYPLGDLDMDCDSDMEDYAIIANAWLDEAMWP